MRVPLVPRGEDMVLPLDLGGLKAPDSAYMIRGALLHKLQCNNGARIKLCYGSRPQNVLTQCQVKPLQYGVFIPH